MAFSIRFEAFFNTLFGVSPGFTDGAATRAHATTEKRNPDRDAPVRQAGR